MKVKKDFVIVLPTHSNYIGITKNFLQMLRKNWKTCPFDIVVSVTGDNVEIDGVNNLYNGENASLIDCLVNVASKYESKYYISFLGDAFIIKTVDDDKIMRLFESIKDNSNKVEYCSLQYVKNYEKEKEFNEYFRYINSLDRYSHNFTAFVASGKFIKNILNEFDSDLEFEKSFLSEKKKFYYDNDFVVKKDFFNLLPSIVGGKWDIINYRKLRKENPEIDFEKRDCLSMKGSLLRHLRNKAVHFLPSSVRINIKKCVEKVFRMKFGVEG